MAVDLGGGGSGVRERPARACGRTGEKSPRRSEAPGAPSCCGTKYGEAVTQAAAQSRSTLAPQQSDASESSPTAISTVIAVAVTADSAGPSAIKSPSDSASMRLSIEAATPTPYGVNSVMHINPA
jgi:hypothetical protein